MAAIRFLLTSVTCATMLALGMPPTLAESGEGGGGEGGDGGGRSDSDPAEASQSEPPFGYTTLSLGGVVPPLVPREAYSDLFGEFQVQRDGTVYIIGGPVVDYLSVDPEDSWRAFADVFTGGAVGEELFRETLQVEPLPIPEGYPEGYEEFLEEYIPDLPPEAEGNLDETPNEATPMSPTTEAIL